jgi:hypothetical protein
MKIYYKTKGNYCLDMCKIKDVAIGSTACLKCEHNIYTNKKQNWVECSGEEEK